ncbi:MAG: hypothetical protein HZB15_03980 [Actinobacteria bacterium]|nr:hypothetical protein [Actinomycetota bacterium]
MNGIGHLLPAAPSAEHDVQARADAERLGFVMNATRLWAHLPPAKQALFDLMEMAATSASLTFRQRAVLVTATAAGLGDPYCSLAWGSRLAGEAGPDVAAHVIRHQRGSLEPADRVLAEWATKVVGDPTATTEHDIQPLRGAGFTDEQIFAMTLFVGLRVTFSLVNDALGAQPDDELIERAPAEVVAAIGLG